MSALLKIENLTKRFSQHTAVNNVSLQILKGENLGIVGESGSGKSTLARCALRLIEPDAGKVLFDEKNILEMNRSELKDFRRHAQIVFQDPYASLNPRMTVQDILQEPFAIHKKSIQKKTAQDRIEYLLDLVGLKKDYLSRFPHEFSGGQRQRIGIARALMLEPSFLVCDEPVSALDVSIQAQILNLFEDLQTKLNLTFLFISHDLRVVRHLCQRIGVMYQGEILELNTADKIFTHPETEYTKKLLSSIPQVISR